MTQPVLSGEGLLCPSAPPEWKGASVIGIVGGSGKEPRVKPLAEPLAVTADVLALAEPVLPTEVFRFAAACATERCRHYQRGACALAQKVVQLLPAIVDDLPFCSVRAGCRWFRQEGRAACIRCPQVVTDNTFPEVAMRYAADPNYTISTQLVGGP
jgi:hypothetical protein